MEASDARVVYVHGNGNKVREDLLKSQWDTALFGADMGAATCMAYWAPLRYPAPLSDAGEDPIDGGPGGPVGLEAPTRSPPNPPTRSSRGRSPRPASTPRSAGRRAWSRPPPAPPATRRRPRRRSATGCAT